MLRVVAHMGALALSHATAYSEMKVTAEIDGLTGLYNKTHTSVTLAEKILESEQLGTPLSILLLDIDNFKNYNDTNGHDAGDHLLARRRARLTSNALVQVHYHRYLAFNTHF